MHSNQLWLDSKMTENIPQYNTSLLTRIKKIPLLAMKFNLQRVDISRCVEKIDYQRMLLAYMLFGGRSAIDSMKLRIYYPQWALEIEEHKVTYFHSKRDAKRTQIYMSELCMIDWVFHFKNDYGYEEEGSSSTAISKFRADYSYYSERFGQTFYWQVRFIEYSTACMLNQKLLNLPSSAIFSFGRILVTSVISRWINILRCAALA